MAEEVKKFRNNLLFEYLNNILKGKDWEKFESHVNSGDFISSYQPFMVSRYLSMSTNKKVRDIILNNQFTLDQMPNKQHYRFLMMSIPKQYSSFITYIK